MAVKNAKKSAKKAAATKKTESLTQFVSRVSTFRDNIREKVNSARRADEELADSLDEYVEAFENAEELIKLLEGCNPREVDAYDANGNSKKLPRTAIFTIQGHDSYDDCNGEEMYDLKTADLEIHEPLIKLLKENVARWRREVEKLLKK